MALPKCDIIISKNGEFRVEGLEKTGDCHKLSDLAREVGKVTKDDGKDHTPVYQTVSQKGA
jgi:hypothetical protein